MAAIPVRRAVSYRHSVHVILFDLDGTVLTFEGPAPGPGRIASDRAMLRLHGLEAASLGVRFAGGTDHAIARALLRRAGVAEDDAAVAAFLAAYLVELDDVLTTRRYRPVGDVHGTVAACRARGAIVGVGTGNVRPGAERKLRSAGVLDAFDLDRGGYGSDGEERASILRAAVARCAPAPSSVVVVGDTEHDVQAARAIGARAVGVAATSAARIELAAAGADRIVDACGPDLVAAISAGAE
jgi:phosphoglycolate phosphatase